MQAGARGGLRDASHDGMADVLRSATELFRAENRIFARWQRRQPALLRDGALGGLESTYVSAPVRVLFLLKEPNDSGERWSANGADLRLQTDAFAELRSTFPVMLLLTMLLQSPGLGLPFSVAREQVRERAVRRGLLRSIAMVNLKKTPGGPVCNDRSLAVAVAAEGDLLREQLALYRPHVTIAGGGTVFSLLAGMRGRLPVPQGSAERRAVFEDVELGTCVSFFHPQATKGFHTMYELLRESLGDWRAATGASTAT